MIIPWALMLLGAPSCQLLPAGGELCLAPDARVPWVEVGIGFKLPPDPPGKAGLSLVGAKALASSVGALPSGWQLEVEGGGLHLWGGVPEGALEAELEPIFAALGRRFDRGVAEVAVAQAVEARRRGLQDDDPALSRYEATRALYGGRLPGIDPYGQAPELLAVGLEDLVSWQRRVACRQGGVLTLAGPVAPEVAARLTNLVNALPDCAPANKTPGAGAPPPVLDLLVVDKPERRQATVVYGHRMGAGPSEAAWLTAVALLSGRGGWLAEAAGSGVEVEVLGPPSAPAALFRFRTVEPGPALARLMAHLENKPSLDGPALERGKAKAATLAASRLRDPAATVRTILGARIEGRSLASVLELSAAIDSLEAPAIEAALRALAAPPKVMVVLTSAEATRVQALGKTPGVRRTVVVGYDTR